MLWSVNALTPKMINKILLTLHISKTRNLTFRNVKFITEIVSEIYFLSTTKMTPYVVVCNYTSMMKQYDGIFIFKNQFEQAAVALNLCTVVIQVYRTLIYICH